MMCRMCSIIFHLILTQTCKARRRRRRLQVCVGAAAVLCVCSSTPPYCQLVCVKMQCVPWRIGYSGDLSFSALLPVIDENPTAGGNRRLAGTARRLALISRSSRLIGAAAAAVMSPSLSPNLFELSVVSTFEVECRHLYKTTPAQRPCAHFCWYNYCAANKCCDRKI